MGLHVVIMGIGADMCEWALDVGYDGDDLYGDWMDDMLCRAEIAGEYSETEATLSEVDEEVCILVQKYGRYPGDVLRIVGENRNMWFLEEGVQVRKNDEGRFWNWNDIVEEDRRHRNTAARRLARHGPDFFVGQRVQVEYEGELHVSKIERRNRTDTWRVVYDVDGTYEDVHHSRIRTPSPTGQRQSWHAPQGTRASRPAAHSDAAALPPNGNGLTYCVQCNVQKNTMAFSRKQQRQPAATRRCKACVSGRQFVPDQPRRWRCQP